MAAARESIRNVVCGNLQWPGAAQAVASAQYVTGRLTLATSCINCQRPARPASYLEYVYGQTHSVSVNQITGATGTSTSIEWHDQSLIIGTRIQR
jgi:hypothetical protein